MPRKLKLTLHYAYKLIMHIIMLVVALSDIKKELCELLIEHLQKAFKTRYLNMDSLLKLQTNKKSFFLAICSTK